ncbi:MAG: tetratricopeptide repeat protein [Planctomycetota bacterium]
MRNKDIERGYDSRLKSLAALSLKLCFCVFCFTFLPLRLLTSLTDIASANSAPNIGQESPPGSLTSRGDPNSPHGRQLWRTEISIAKGQEDEKNKNELKRIIEQIRSVEFEPQKQAPEPLVVPEETPAIEPNETLSESDVPVEKDDEKAETEPKLPYEPITDQTLQMLRNLSQHPDEMDNPLGLGDILFLSGNPKEAVMFYQEALERKNPNDVSSSRDRAWVLFQIGNCLRNDDLPTAAKTYGQLLTEYPNSPWADLARFQGKLIDWYLKDEPRKLIAEVEHAGSE